MRRALRVLLVVLLVWLIVALALGAAVLVYGAQDRAQPADVIIVLGSGLRRDNLPGPALVRRASHAAALYQQGLADTLICTGGYTAGRTRSEASGCLLVLEQMGVPASAVLLEERSRSTEENASFARDLMRERGLNTAILVSDGYHLLRAQWIFAQQGIPVYPSPADPPRRLSLLIATVREVAALHWQLLKTVLNLPFTYVPVV